MQAVKGDSLVSETQYIAIVQIRCQGEWETNNNNARNNLIILTNYYYIIGWLVVQLVDQKS